MGFRIRADHDGRGQRGKAFFGIECITTGELVVRGLTPTQGPRALAVRTICQNLTETSGHVGNCPASSGT